MKRWSRWSAVSLFASLVVLCAVYVFEPAIRARYLFRQVETLQAGRSSRADAERLARKLGAKQDESCDQSYCFWIVTVDNKRLPRWWRGEGVSFLIDFEARDSKVDYRGAGYVIGTNPPFSKFGVSTGVKEKWVYIRPSVNQHIIEEPATSAGWRMGYFEGNGTRTIADEKFVVWLTPRSTPDDWKRFTTFNYSCLWKYRSCRNPRELLPISASYLPPAD